MNKTIFNETQLDNALYNATDIMQRCLLPFILLGDTAKDIKGSSEVLNDADGVYLGIEERYMIPEVWSNLHVFSKNKDLNYGMNDYEESKDYIRWTHQGVPVNIQIIHKKYKFFSRPDTKFYRLEQYQIPNPFDSYWKARYLIK